MVTPDFEIYETSPIKLFTSTGRAFLFVILKYMKKVQSSFSPQQDALSCLIFLQKMLHVHEVVIFLFAFIVKILCLWQNYGYVKDVS